jgi:hypothetical protein
VGALVLIPALSRFLLVRRADRCHAEVQALAE